MTYAQDDRLNEAKAKDITTIADLLGIEGLARHGTELVGPCPQCGGDDRFSINGRKGVFQCRRCEGKGDVIQLVRWIKGFNLPQALEWLCGPPQELTQEERDARNALAARNKARKDDRAEAERKKAIADARRIWKAGLPAEGTAVRDYLTRRGFGRDVLPVLPACLRYCAELPYMVRGERGWVELHRGPAMLAAVQRPSRKFSAVHRTWIDLAQPKGKAVLLHPQTGKLLPSKKVLGSKKGGAIRLLSRSDGDRTLVMAEGIETTLTAMVSGAYPGAEFWAGVDLGNIAGSRQLGPGLKYAGLPDMSDQDCFLPPPWIKRLILIEDGDSDPRDTRAKLQAGARRAMARIPGLTAQIVPCPAGADLNDLLMGPEAVD